MKNNKDLWTLIIALALPVLLIIVMAAYLYLPTVFVKPRDNFIYYTPSYGSNAVSYKVTNNRLTYQPPMNYNKSAIGVANYQWSDIYLYNTALNQKQKITFAEAQGYFLSTEIKSPNGFEIVHGSGGGGFPFGYSSGDYYSRFLKKGGFSRKLDLGLSNLNYNFTFLGWVVNNGN